MHIKFIYLNTYFSCQHFVFVCIFCIYFIEISFLLNDVSRYVTISSPGLGAQQRPNGQLCTLWTLNTLIRAAAYRLLSSPYKIYQITNLSFLHKHFQNTTKKIISYLVWIKIRYEMTWVRNDLTGYEMTLGTK